MATRRSPGSRPTSGPIRSKDDRPLPESEELVMKIAVRALAGLTFLLGLLCLLLSLAAGVGVWVVKGPVTDRATRLFARVEAALDVADNGLDHAGTSLGTAAQRLDSARDEQRKLSGKPQQGGALKRTLARTVQRRVAPEINNATGNLHTVAEAAVVVNSILEDLGNFPLLSTTGLDVDQLNDINTQLAGVGPAAWELSRLLGEPGPDADVDAQLSRVEQALKGLVTLVAEYKSRVAEARARKEEVKSRVFAWITPGAVIISLVCFWIALSQLSVLAHARAWWTSAGENAPS